MSRKKKGDSEDTKRGSQKKTAGKRIHVFNGKERKKRTRKEEKGEPS